MFKRTAAWTFALVVIGAALASTPAGDPWQDVLDQPAMKTPLAQHALINGPLMSRIQSRSSEGF